MVVLLVIEAVIVAGLTAVCELHFRSIRRMQPELARVQGIQASIGQLIAESLEYSKKNQSILKVLESTGLRSQPSQSQPVQQQQGRSQTR